MDRTGIIVIAICVVLLVLTWPKIEPPPRNTQTGTTSTNAPSTNLVNQPTQPTGVPVLPAGTGFAAPVSVEAEELVSLKTEESTYTFTSAGGLKTIGLNHHVSKPCSETNNMDVIQLNHGVDLPIFSMKGLDDSAFNLSLIHI